MDGLGLVPIRRIVAMPEVFRGLPGFVGVRRRGGASQIVIGGRNAMTSNYPEHDPSCGCHLCVPPPPYRPEPPPVVNPNERPAPCRTETAEDDIRPTYYVGKGGMQPIDVMMAFDLPPCLAFVVKHVLRCGKKGPRIVDLRKALEYLTREIAAEEAAR